MSEDKRCAASNLTRRRDRRNLQVPIHDKEENPRANHAEVGFADVQDLEDDVECVELVGVAENLEHLPANGAEARNPHGPRAAKTVAISPTNFDTHVLVHSSICKRPPHGHMQPFSLSTIKFELPFLLNGTWEGQ
ncbi:uncharacterized protein J3R85_013120 [Psidium guajava]|nr:uncharacterized protein J3R85_013120 [Psidium guajava]